MNCLALFLIDLLETVKICSLVRDNTINASKTPNLGFQILESDFPDQLGNTFSARVLLSEHPQHKNSTATHKPPTTNQEIMAQENDLYPIILTAPQSDSCSSIDYDELLPIERQLLNNSSSSLPRKSCGGVSFSGFDSVVDIESSEEWSEEERDNVWYSHYDLEKCKRDAIKLCKRQAKGRASKTEGSTRDYVAHLAETWSSTNKANAHTIAVRDMYEAYFPHMIEQQTENQQSTTSHTLSPVPKRDFDYPDTLAPTLCKKETGTNRDFHRHESMEPRVAQGAILSKRFFVRSTAISREAFFARSSAAITTAKGK
eukprot:scaffold2334_cov118-Cylindrotheca_fusiformis.AAC.9